MQALSRYESSETPASSAVAGRGQAEVDLGAMKCMKEERSVQGGIGGQRHHGRRREDRGREARISRRERNGRRRRRRRRREEKRREEGRW